MNFFNQVLVCWFLGIVDFLFPREKYSRNEIKVFLCDFHIAFVGDKTCFRVVWFHPSWEPSTRLAHSPTTRIRERLGRVKAGKLMDHDKEVY